MVALAPNTSETSTWDVLDGFPKLHSRAREVKTTRCTEAPASKSFGRVEIWLVISESCVGLESFTRDPIGFKGGDNFYSFVLGWAMSAVDPSGLDGYPLGPWVGGQQYPYLLPGQRVPGHPHNPTGPVPSIPPVRNPFNSLFPLLSGMCNTCCSDSGACKCGGDANKITDALNDVWRENYGRGPTGPNQGPGDDTVGGFYCSQWSNLFHDALSAVQQGSSCFSFDRVRSDRTDGSGRMHAWVRISVGRGGPGCEVNADDGWGNGDYIHTEIPVRDPSVWDNPTVSPKFEHKSWWEKFWENYHPFGL